MVPGTSSPSRGGWVRYSDPVDLAVALTPFVVLTSGSWPAPDLRMLLAGLALGVLGTGGAQYLMRSLAGEGETRGLVHATHAAPCVAVLVGTVALRERFSIVHLVAVTLILVGAHLATRARGFERRRAPSPTV